jgi:hypothetical protein
MGLRQSELADDTIIRELLPRDDYFIRPDEIMVGKICVKIIFASGRGLEKYSTGK